MGVGWGVLLRGVTVNGGQPKVVLYLACSVIGGIASH